MAPHIPICRHQMNKYKYHVKAAKSQYIFSISSHIQKIQLFNISTYYVKFIFLKRGPSWRYLLRLSCLYLKYYIKSLVITKLKTWLVQTARVIPLKICNGSTILFKIILDTFIDRVLLRTPNFSSQWAEFCIGSLTNITKFCFFIT